jgi:hypothetical protein
MNIKKLVIATVAVGVVMMVLDFVIHVQILSGPYYSQLPSLFKQSEPPMVWIIIGDLVAALVFVWVYDRVYGSFGGGWKGGATYGLFAGILVNFPTWLFMNLVLEGFPYGLAWIWTIVGVVYGVILGAVAGALYKKEAAPAIA